MSSLMYYSCFYRARKRQGYVLLEELGRVNRLLFLCGAFFC